MDARKKLLIVEDDEFLYNAYRVKLSKAGFELEIATDGEEALKKLETFTPDLILLDLVMPIKDGFSTLEQIKAQEKYKAIPVLISSNLGQQEDIDKGFELGAADYIVKSKFSLDDIVGKINTTLGTKI